MSWFRKKIRPSFWISYIDSFHQKQQTEIAKIRFVVFDTETTGFDTKQDRILSIGSLSVIGNTLKVSETFECYLKQDVFKAETVKIHGLLKEGDFEKLAEKEAIIAFLKHIKNAVLVAHHASFDSAMINQALKRLQLPKLKNKVLDTSQLFVKTKLDSSKKHFSLDELSQKFNIPQHDRHTASGDAYITALLFVKLLAILQKKNPSVRLKDLLRSNERLGLV